MVVREAFARNSSEFQGLFSKSGEEETMNTTSTKAVITVIGVDAVGIIAKVSGKCTEYNVNILDITQKVYDTTFAMIMLVDTNGMKGEFAKFAEILKETGKELGVSIHTTHEELYNTMYHV